MVRRRSVHFRPLAPGKVVATGQPRAENAPQDYNMARDCMVEMLLGDRFISLGVGSGRKPCQAGEALSRCRRTPAASGRSRRLGAGTLTTWRVNMRTAVEIPIR